MKINVADNFKPGSFIVPLFLKDSLKNEWKYSLEFEVAPSVIEDYNLQQNYPNPFNGTTLIKYSLPNATEENVRLVIYDLLGQEVRTLVNEEQQSGNQTVIWNGKDDLGRMCTSGIYLYSISTDSFREVKKMIFLE